MGPLPLAFYAPQISRGSDSPPLVLSCSGSTEKREPVAALPRRKRAVFVTLPRSLAACARLAGACGLRLSFYLQVTVEFQSVPAASRAAARGSIEKREPVAALPRRKRTIFVPLPRSLAACVRVAGAWGLGLSLYLHPFQRALRVKTAPFGAVLIMLRQQGFCSMRG